MLEAVARERLLKTLQAEEVLACSDFLIVEINGSFVNACSSEWVV
jgi:hypothetical protein